MDLTVQVETFAMLAVTGMILGFIFDFYRVIRGIYRLRTLTTAMSDLLYWLLATVVAGAVLLYSNWGEMRLYVVIALITGAFSYFRLLSRYALRLIIQLLRWTETVIHWFRVLIGYLLIKPLSYLLRLLTRPVVFVSRKIRSASRFFETKDPNPPA